MNVFFALWNRRIYIGFSGRGRFGGRGFYSRCAGGKQLMHPLIRELICLRKSSLWEGILKIILIFLLKLVS